MGLIGMILALIGISFKIAAAPMHFYVADVYEGAAAPVGAFLAFVPKSAGMIAMILLLATLGWSGHQGLAPGLPTEILTVLWMVAVLTMTLGNIGALLQKSVKRLLAYSSIAHSGYMIIGLIAGPGLGINGILFYLLAYGVMNTAAFAVLAALERRGEEIETLDDVAGLRHRHPLMSAVVAVSALSLIGMPPLLGFVGKLYLFIAGVEAGQISLIVIAGLNSAVSAWYYLGLVALALMASPSAQSEGVVRRPGAWPRVAAILTAVAIIVLPIRFFSARLLSASENATMQVHADHSLAGAVIPR
jgi:NADH-quinone oxidoreductase subunit N